MNHHFIKKEGNRQLILVFGGWSVGKEFYSDLCFPEWDTLLVNGYSDSDFDPNLLAEYDSVALFAWSLGVFMASRLITDENVCMAVAINGTEFPLSDNYGIPEKIFIGTAENLSTASLTKFQKRMAGKRFNEVSDVLNELSDIDSLRNELLYIKNRFSESKSEKTNPLHWTRSYVYSDDLIFPAEVQKNFWSVFHPSTEVISAEGSHLPDLKQIIGSIIVDRKKIGDKFQNALPDYDDNAVIQQKIAEKLAMMAPDVRCEKIVEIGHGSGLFSRLITERLHPESVDFIDLYPVSPFGFAKNERYIVADAEKWVGEQAENTSEVYDAIVSSSAIQWFYDPARFLKNCHKLLKPGGFLLFSTFSPENFKELRRLNPFPMLYHSQEEYLAILDKYFQKVVSESETVNLDFPTHRHLLRHIISTGAGATGKRTALSDEKQGDKIKSLTYSPLYFLAVKEG